MTIQIKPSLYCGIGQGELRNKFGIDIYFDKANKDPYKIGKTDQIKVQWGGGIVPLQEASPLVKSLKQIIKRRVYAPLEKRSEVLKSVESFLDERRWEMAEIAEMSATQASSPMPEEVARTEVGLAREIRHIKRETNP